LWIAVIALTRTGIHPRVKPEDMLRSKTLQPSAPAAPIDKVLTTFP
jgi:hypothetical protein